MFCRFCGTTVQSDSRYCSKCGKELGQGSRGRLDARLRKFYLKTPYPYAALFFLLFGIWAIQPRQAPPDYSMLRLELELEGESSVPEENLFRHHFSLVVENLGIEPLADIPVELRASIEPIQPVEVVSAFLSRRLVILRDSRPIPLVVILGDELGASEKRRYAIDGIVTTEPPANLTYQVLGEGTGEVLASYTAAIRRDPPIGPVATLGLDQ